MMDNKFGSERSPDPPVSVSEVVIERVAERLDESPTALEPPLNDAIDPDALDRLFADRETENGGPDARITFRFAGCRVSVDGSESVSVTLTEDEQADG
jgi:hypothetical protein